ncbi:hypothetical protein M409DRAFT_29761 [Zasmidium cellare ATCC 36951]|uniref:DUF7918 domain-containing protein n=1 Tax=Zasmidium cellare ATCC 36951 TaxID=1080233 RepID=A0A6A6C2W8_ZASCE|nr:uncharacterized protein M409DRAFT_29761 [Zasmidium cellare ATCC 36951]KAF2159756.1 hypothetical protein M409DRAFT_29761 [Zasmidium cellare ATCC 36951]
MPTLDGLHITIVQGGFEMPEYPDDAATRTESSRSVLVEIHSGPFAIQIRLPGWMPLLGNFVVANFIIDGHETHDMILSPPGQLNDILGLSNEKVLVPMSFHHLTANVDGSDLSEYTNEQLGSIWVRLRHAKFNYGAPVQGPSDVLWILPPRVTAEALKEKGLSHAVLADSGTALQEPCARPPYEYVGGERDTYLFRFKYRSRRALEEIGIVERTAQEGEIRAVAVPHVPAAETEKSGVGGQRPPGRGLEWYDGQGNWCWHVSKSEENASILMLNVKSRSASRPLRRQPQFL